MTDSCVEFTNLIKAYDGTDVITNISLQIPALITTAMVGESGSGKSTLLQIINGLVKPDSGDVRVLGQSIDYQQLPQIRRKMGYAVQGAGLFPHLTVFENATLVARLEGWSKNRIDARFADLISLLELPEEFRDRYPHSLSGGQQQRVSLCRAMMLDPPLMLLDEPFSALDPITRGIIHEEFIRLQVLGPRSTILVTHDMSEAVRLAQYLVILKEGVVVQSGLIEAVQENPVDDYVRDLFQRVGQ